MDVILIVGIGQFCGLVVCYLWEDEGGKGGGGTGSGGDMFSKDGRTVSYAGAVKC